MNQARLSKVLELMGKQNLEQMLISDPAAIFYLTGKWIHPGERLLCLLIKAGGDHKLFINELFPVTDDLGAEKIWFNDTQDGVSFIAEHTDSSKALGVDKVWPARFLLRLMELNGASSYTNGSEILDRVRMNKDEDERQKMRIASEINDRAMERIQKELAEGVTEVKMAQILSGIYEELGADGFSFNPIIGYGANAADPHHDIDKSVVKEGDSVIFDIGCVKDSYCSDMTRTAFYKSVSEKGREVFEIVKEANIRAIAAVKPGVRFCDIDAAARDYITEKGYGKYFTHRTGHSIGIECHDYGDVSSVNTMPVEEGMIFSIEPGIYLPGEVGVRIEDLVLVTADGCEVLNKYPKDLLIIK